MTVHDCVFSEIEILEDDGELRVGDLVLRPCRTCGETPGDHVEWLQAHVDEATAALFASRPTMPLFHWAPAARRKQIIRYGLRPGSRANTSSESFPVICFADSASWAWALSGDMRWTPPGEWDLWQTSLDRLVDPIILPGRGRLSGIYEVRTSSRVFKRDLWHVGSRVKPGMLRSSGEAPGNHDGLGG